MATFGKGDQSLNPSHYNCNGGGGMLGPNSNTRYQIQMKMSGIHQEGHSVSKHPIRPREGAIHCEKIVSNLEYNGLVLSRNYLDGAGNVWGSNSFRQPFLFIYFARLGQRIFFFPSPS